MKKEIIILGSQGQLGRELGIQLQERGLPYVGYDIPEVDITDFEATKELIGKHNPSVLINCAAMTNVDGCETAEEEAYLINAEGPRNLAKIAAELDIPLVQVSTDYVFDGKGITENGVKRPYTEEDTPSPVSVYGKSKLAGEEAVKQETGKYFIIRTAWLYGDGHNFVKTMLKLADNHDQVNVVNDQLGSPTSTVDLAGAILDLIETEEYGIYHGTCEGECVWSDFAKAIFREAGKPTKVIPVDSETYAESAGRPVATRPEYSVLENGHLASLGLNSFRPWEEALTEYIEKIV